MIIMAWRRRLSLLPLYQIDKCRYMYRKFGVEHRKWLNHACTYNYTLICSFWDSPFRECNEIEQTVCVFSMCCYKGRCWVLFLFLLSQKFLFWLLLMYPSSLCFNVFFLLKNNLLINNMYSQWLIKISHNQF